MGRRRPHARLWMRRLHARMCSRRGHWSTSRGPGVRRTQRGDDATIGTGAPRLREPTIVPETFRGGTHRIVSRSDVAALDGLSEYGSGFCEFRTGVEADSTVRGYRRPRDSSTEDVERNRATSYFSQLHHCLVATRVRYGVRRRRISVRGERDRTRGRRIITIQMSCEVRRAVVRSGLEKRVSAEQHRSGDGDLFVLLYRRSRPSAQCDLTRSRGESPPVREAGGTPIPGDRS